MPRAALLIAVVAGAVFLVAAGDRLVFANDEGVFLAGAVRILQGETLYRDFFSNTGPGTFWMLAALLRVFGITLESARLLRAADLAAMTGLTFWIAARLGRRSTAAFAAVLFAALALGIPNGLVINHRWEASAFELAAVAVVVRLMERPHWSGAAAAGALATIGAWCTPSLGLVAVVIAAWICWHPKLRRTVPAFALGTLPAALIPAAVLIHQEALLPLLRAMVWNSARYALANRISYGAMFESPGGLLAVGNGAQRAVTALFLLATFLPAILPPLAALAWLPSLRNPRSPEILLLLSGVAFIGSTYPRWDLLHLLYGFPVFAILVAIWVERHVRRAAAVALAAVVLIPAGVMAAKNLAGPEALETVDTPVGKIKASPADARQLRVAVGAIRRGETLFVFPYQPMLYFLTAARNPTRYSFVQPGMMSQEDERAVTNQLKDSPPQWLLYAEFSPQDYLRVWPSSNPRDLRMPAIEDFIREYYIRWPGAENEGVEYRLLARRPAAPAP